MAEIADNKISAFVMGIIGVAVVLAIGLIVMGEIKTSTYETDTISNEEVTLLNDTNVSFAVTKGVDGTQLTLNSVINASGSTFTASNYTFYAAAGSIEVISGFDYNWNAAVVNVSYSFTNHSDASLSLATNVTNIAKIPTWIGILITVALAFIVLSYFYGRAR